MTTTIRDTQRSKLYKAERAAFTETEKTYTSMREVKQYIRWVLSKATIKDRYEKQLRREISIEDGRGSRAARGGVDSVHFPVAMRKDWVILHELAHTISLRMYGYGRIAYHGWEFADIYLTLVRFCLGAEAADTLKTSFRKHKVRWRPKQKRVATPEQIARLAAAREAHKLTKVAEAA